MGQDPCRVILNQGNHEFGEIKNLGERGVPVALDMDHDGDLDLAVGVLLGNIILFRNDGGGEFTSDGMPPVPAGGGAFSRTLTAGDVNEDGFLDLVWSDSDQVRVSLRNAAGEFDLPLQLRTKSWVGSLLAGDWNRDGKPDLATFGDVFSLYLNDGTGSLGRPALSDETGGSLTAGDFDGDGDLDLALITVTPGTWTSNATVLLNDGNGKFPDRRETGAADGFMFGSIVAAVANRDGKLDLVVGAASSQTSRWLLSLINSGDGTFFESPMVAIPEDSYYVTAGDVNGDGFADAVVPQRSASTVTVYLNQGDGSFEERGVFEAATDVRAPVVVVDLDGDGALDLAVPYDLGGVSVLRNLGNGDFAPARKYTVGGGPSDILAADVDGNGSLDLVIPCSSPTVVSVLLNRGDGNFFRHRSFPIGTSPE
ncbi:MAG: FG-GAP repeat domain-containing protein, partial [Thermoanaerobaculia bacterium]